MRNVSSDRDFLKIEYADMTTMAYSRRTKVGTKPKKIKEQAKKIRE